MSPCTASRRVSVLCANIGYTTLRPLSSFGPGEAFSVCAHRSLSLSSSSSSLDICPKDFRVGLMQASDGREERQRIETTKHRSLAHACRSVENSHSGQSRPLRPTHALAFDFLSSNRKHPLFNPRPRPLSHPSWTFSDTRCHLVSSGCPPLLVPENSRASRGRKSRDETMDVLGSLAFCKLSTLHTHLCIHVPWSRAQPYFAVARFNYHDNGDLGTHLEKN